MMNLPLFPLLLLLPFLIAACLRFDRDWSWTASTLIGGSIVTLLAWGGAIFYGGEWSWEVTSLAHQLPIAFAFNPEGNMFALAICTLWVCASIYTTSYAKHHHIEAPARFYAYLTLAVGVALAAAMADNLMTLFVCYECLTLVTYPLVLYRHTEAAYTAGRYYIITLVGMSLLTFLPCVLVVYAATGTTEFKPEGIVLGHMPPLTIALLWVGCVLGVAKTAVMPLHRWLLQAMVAPTPVSAMLHAVVVVKVGLFTLLKIATGTLGVVVMQYVRGGPSGWLLASITYLALASALIAAIQAIRQDHLKRRLAYSTISHLSQGVLAISLAPEAIRWLILSFIISHGFAKIVLFFVAGTPGLDARNLSVRRMEGVAYAMPWSMACFTIASLSLVGLPPFAGFFVKEMIHGTLPTGQATILSMGLLTLSMLGVGYLIAVVVLAYRHQEFPAVRHEAPPGMRIAMMMTVTCLLAWSIALPMWIAAPPSWSVGLVPGYFAAWYAADTVAHAIITVSVLAVAIGILYLQRRWPLQLAFAWLEKGLHRVDEAMQHMPSLPAMATARVASVTLSDSTALLILLAAIVVVAFMV